MFEKGKIHRKKKKINMKSVNIFKFSKDNTAWIC